MAKKIKTPQDHPVLKFIRRTYPKVEKRWPWLAHTFAFQFFFMPMKFKRPARENEAFKTARIDVLEYQRKNAHIFSWGSADNPTILLVHGWMGRATQFHEFIQKLKEKYFVVSFDAPAHGESKGFKTDISEFANIIQHVYDTYGPIHAAIGHSLGGAALIFARSLGTPLDRITMIASPSIAHKILASYAAILNGSEQTIESFDQQIRKKFNSEFKDFAASTLIQKVEIADLQLVYDEDDKEVTSDHGEEMLKAKPDAELILTQGLGHNRILRDPWTIDQIIRFVEKDNGKIDL